MTAKGNIELGVANQMPLTLPRNAENPTRETSEGRKANARISKYGLA